MAQMKRFMIMENFEQAFILRDSLKAFYKGQYDLAAFSNPTVPFFSYLS
jgi:hypothetical protein